MVRYDIDKNGKLVLVQEIVEPMIYLDHWALRKISEDPPLRARFIDAMAVSKGTLAISWLNITEFSQLSSPQAHELAESLVEALLPALFFMESNPVTVWTNEDLQVQGKHPMPAHADVELLKMVASFKPVGLNLFSVRGLFSHVRDSSVRESLRDLTHSMIGHIENLRQQYLVDAAMRRSAKRAPASTPHPKGTRQLFRELITTLLVDQKMPVTNQHASDLLHCIVPLAYCNYVLLDAHWEEQVSRVRRKLVAAGRKYDIATVFSERNGGLAKFFEKLAPR